MGAHSENWRRILTKKGRGTAYSNEYQPIKRKVTKVRAVRINEHTLDPVIGKLRNILVYGGPDNLRHIYIKCMQEEPICSLHRFAFGRSDNKGKMRAQYMWCNNCHVVLCMSCFGKFHTVKNPKQLKVEVMRETNLTTKTTAKKKEATTKKRKR